LPWRTRRAAARLIRPAAVSLSGDPTAELLSGSPGITRSRGCTATSLSGRARLAGDAWLGA
jgi:hypothetical protein